MWLIVLKYFVLGCTTPFRFVFVAFVYSYALFHILCTKLGFFSLGCVCVGTSPRTGECGVQLGGECDSFVNFDFFVLYFLLVKISIFYLQIFLRFKQVLREMMVFFGKQLPSLCFFRILLFFLLYFPGLSVYVGQLQPIEVCICNSSNCIPIALNKFYEFKCRS